MILQVYKDGADFLDKTQTWLLEDEPSNNLILGLAIRLKQYPSGRYDRPYLATVEKDDRLILAALMTPPNPLVLFCPYEPDHEACDIVAQDLKAGGWPMVGVNATPTLARVFAETWKNLCALNFEVRSRMNLYKLEQVIWPTPMPSGSLCQTTLQDIPLIEDWVYQFQKEAMNLDDREEVKFTTEDVIASHSLHVWVDDGRPVTMAAGRRPTPHGIAISMVYTPPEFRKRGYASACVASLSQYYLDSGKSFCTLYANTENLEANKIYRQIGFQWISDITENTFI